MFFAIPWQYIYSLYSKLLGGGRHVFFVLFPIITHSLPKKLPPLSPSVVTKKPPCIFDDATALVGFHPWVLLCAPVDALHCKFPLPWEAHSSFVWGSAMTYETVLWGHNVLDWHVPQSPSPARHESAYPNLGKLTFFDAKMSHLHF